MTDDDFDFPVDDDQAQSDLWAEVEKVRQSKSRLKAMTEETKSIQTMIDRTLRETIPEMMTAQGLKEVSGEEWKVKLAEKVEASLPSPPNKRSTPESLERREGMLQWIDDHGYGHLINRELRVAFDLDQAELAQQVIDDLKAEGLEVQDSKTIHWARLNSLVKQLRDENIDVPNKLFGLREFTEAKISPVKKGK